MNLLRNILVMLVVLVVGMVVGQFDRPVFGALRVPDDEDPKMWKPRKMTVEEKAAWDKKLEEGDPNWPLGKQITRMELVYLNKEEIKDREWRDGWDAEKVIAAREELLDAVPEMRERVAAHKRWLHYERLNLTVFWILLVLVILGFVWILFFWRRKPVEDSDDEVEGPADLKRELNKPAPAARANGEGFAEQGDGKSPRRSVEADSARNGLDVHNLSSQRDPRLC